MQRVTGPYFDRLAISALTIGNRDLHMHEQRGLRDHLVWRQVRKGLRLFVKAPFESLPWLNRTCLYCEKPLVIIERVERPRDEDCFEDILAALELCINCRYWRWHFLDSTFEAREGSYSHHYVSYVSKLKEFTANLPDGCSEDLAEWVRRRPYAWDDIHPRRLERFVADVFRANNATSEVTHVGASGDGGVDVLFVESSGLQWLIQVKRRSQLSRGEGVGTIRNLLGAMVLHPARCGIVVSTADHFTYQARVKASRAQRFGMTVRLIDRNMLNRMLDPVLPAAPWYALISRRFPDYATWLAKCVPPLGDHSRRARKPRSVSLTTSKRQLFLNEASLVEFFHDDNTPTSVSAASR